MAERKIPYIIELTASDEKLKQDLSKLNWEEILGQSKGKSFKDVLVKDTKEARQEIVRTLGGLNIDWTKILGTKEIGKLEQVVAKALSNSRKELEVFASKGDTTGIENTIKYVTALGDELKGLGSNFDAKALARGIGAFMKVLSNDKISKMVTDTERLVDVFGRLADVNVLDGVTRVSQGFTVIGDEASKAAVKTTQAIKDMEKHLSSIDALFNKGYDIKINADLDKQFSEIEKEIESTSKDIRKLAKEMDSMSVSDKNFESTRNKLVEKYTRKAELYRSQMLLNEKYASKYPEDKDLLMADNKSFQREINEIRGKVSSLIEDAQRQINSLSKSTKTTKDGINIPIKLPTQSDLVKTINQYVDGINKSKSIHSIKIDVDKDIYSPIEDKTRRAYKDNPADDDVITTELVNKTASRFDKIAEAIDEKQQKIITQTETWRKKMLEQFKFKSGDFDFTFNDNLIESLQSLFDDYSLKVNIDPQHLADQIKTVLNSSGGSIGGGTASIDANSMASAIAMGLRAALTGEMPQVATNSGSSNVGEDIPRQVDHIATEIEQTGRHLDLAEDYVKDVVEKLKAVAKYTSKDSKGSIATRNRFDALGIDLHKVKNASDVGNDAEIVSMIENSLLQRDEFGKLKGSTLISELSTFKGSSSKTIPAFLSSMNEVFFMLQEDTQSVEEWTRKRQSKEVFDSARKVAQDAVALQKVRLSAKKGDIPSLNEIDGLTSILEPYWKRVASQSLTYKSKDIEQLAETKRKSNSSLSFEQSIEEARNEIYNQILVDIKSAFTTLRSAREVLGDKTDDASIEEFRSAADLFYKSTTKVFKNLKEQAEKTFEGTVDFQGKNNKAYSKYIKGYKNIAKIKDDEVIVDVKVSSTLSNTTLGTAGSKNGRPVSEAEEKRMMRNATRPEYVVPREYEQDILNKPMTYKGFKAQNVDAVSVNFDATIEKQKQTIVDSKDTITKLHKNLKSLDKEVKSKQNQVETLKKTLNLIGDEPVYQTHSTNDYDEKFDTLHTLKRNAKVANEANLPKEGYSSEISDALNKKTALNDRLSKLSEQTRIIENLTVEQAKKRLQELSKNLVPDEEMALYQKFIDNPIDPKILKDVKEMPGYSKDELKKRKAMSESDIQMLLSRGKSQRENIGLYSRFIQNPDSIRNEIFSSIQQTTQESVVNQKNLDSYIVAWAKSEETKIPEAEVILRQAAEKVLSKIGSTMNSLYKDMIATEEKLKSNISDEEKTVLTAHMQDLFKVFGRAQEEYDNLIRQNKIVRKRPLGADRLKNITSLQSQYSGSVRSELGGMLSSATSEIAELNAQKSRLKQQELKTISRRESSESLIQRAEAEKEYNALLEKSLTLQGSIEKMTADGESEKKIEKKRKQLEKVNDELAEAKTKVDALGGLLGQGNEKEYSDSDRKTYALNELKNIEDDLITAKAQKRVSESRIFKKDREIADLDKWGLGAGIGASELGKTKNKLTSEFMSSDYVQSQVNALREKTKVAIAEAENRSREIFDKKVAMAMEHLNWNPLDQTQVQKFLNTKHGQQLSNDFASEVDTNTTNMWKQYDEYRKDLLARLRTEFQDSFKTDNGVLTATSKVQDETGQWINEIVEIRVKEALRTRLEAEKRILEEKHAPVQANIDRLEADRATAIEYGGVSDKELLSGDIIKDQIRKEERLAQLQAKRAEIQQKLNDLENAGVDHSDDTYKSTKKDLNSFDKEIARYEMLIKNRQKLIQMRYDESKEPSYTDEEKELHFTNQIVSYNEKIENSLVKQKALKEQIASAIGDDKTKLERQLSIEEANVAKWREKIPTFENKLSRLQASKSQGAIGGILPEGGIVGIIVSAVSEAIGSLGAGVEINTEDLAKEATLRAILQVLGGIPSGDDGYGLGRGRKATNLDNVWKEIPTYKNATTNIDTLRDKAVELKSTLDTLYDEGKADTVDFLKAQTELSRVLTLLRNKVSKDNSNIYGEKGNKESAKQAQEYWKTYLTSGDSKLFDNLNNVSLTSMNKAKFNSKLKEINGTGNNLSDEKSQTKEPVPVKVVEDKSKKKTRKTQTPKKTKIETHTDAQQSSTRQVTGGLIQLVGRLATEDTLIQVLSALHTLGTTEGGITAPTAAGDLYNQFRALLLGGSIDDHERLAYMNSEAGVISGNVIGNIANISDELIKALRAKYPTAQGFDTQIHTHGKSTQPYFSKEDYQHFTKDYESGIKKQVLLTKDSIAVLDLTAVESAEEVKALMDELIKAGNSAKAIKKVFENTKSGALFETAKFDNLNANSLVKMLGAKVDAKPQDTSINLDEYISKLQKYEELIKHAKTDGYLMGDDLDANKFESVTQEVKDMIEALAKGEPLTDEMVDNFEALHRRAVDIGKIVETKINQNKKMYAGTKEMNSVERQYNNVLASANIDPASAMVDLESTNNPKVLQEYINRYNALNAQYLEYVNNRQIHDPVIQQQLKQQAAQVQIFGKRAALSIAEAQKLDQLVAQSGFYETEKGEVKGFGGTKGLDDTEIKNLEVAMRNYVKELGQGNIENAKFNKKTQQLTYTFRINKDTVADMVVKYNGATKALYAYNKEERESLTGMAGFMQGIKSKMKSITQYVISITSISDVLRYLRQGVTYIREVDSALTELKKVTDETEETYDRFLNTAAKTADRVGSTIKEIVSSTADWARLGYSMKEAAELAESTSVLLNVSEFQSIDDATSALTSTMQAFGYAAKDSMHVVDVMNEIGNNYAISSDGVATALQDSASSLMAANNSYQEAVALIAAANRVVQDPNSVGAALRTISLRLRGTSTKELEEAGEDTTGVVESKSKLRTKIQGYTGIDILTDSGAYKSTYEILLEISKVWDDLTDQDRAGLLELIAGKTRSNTAAAILSNTKDLEAAYKSAMDAEGSALAENEKYLDSIQGRIDLFNNAVQTMWNTELDTGVVKFFVDLGTSLVKVVDNLGLINTLVFALMSYFTIFRKNKFDIASMIGLHDIEQGWFHKKKNKQTSVGASTTSFTPVAGEQIDMFSDEMQTQAQINERIKQLNTAKAELKSLQNKKWKDIEVPIDALEYRTGNRKRSYVNEVLIPDKQAEIVAIQKDIDDITLAAKLKLDQSKMKLREDNDGQMMFDFDGMSQELDKVNTKYLDIFQNGLGKGATQKLDVNFDELSRKLKDLDGLDGEGIRNYMLNLDDLGDISEDTKIALAGYASTVEDGTYSIQGAQRYVREYNKSLAVMSKQAMKAQIVQNLLNLAISGIAMLGSAIITGIINKIASAQDEFEELSSELSSVASELQSFETELNGINEQIKELQSQGTLSFSEQEELDRLKEESAELERQIDLQKTLQEQKQKQMNQQAPEAAENYYKKTGINSGKTTKELAGEGAKTGLMIGAAIAGALISALTAGLGTGLGIAAAAGIVAGGTALGAAGGAIYGGSEEKVGESIDNMQEKYIELQQKYADAQTKYEETLKDKDYEKAQKAQEQLTEFEGNMAKHLSELNIYYSQMNWESATDDQRKAMQDFYDTQDKWAIASGGADAKVNAIDRIFGTKADKKLQDVGKELKRMAKDGEEIDLKKAFDISGLNQADLEKFSARLHEMGIYVYEVEDAFKQAAEAAEDLANIDIYEASKSVGSLSDGLESLKSAFDEVNEKGYVTAKTLDEIKETLGNTDQLGGAWTNYQNIMSSATASTEEMKQATEELVKAFVDNKIAFADGPISEDEMAVYVRQLKDMGVENAEEYIADRVQEGMYTKIQLEAEFDEEQLKDKFTQLKDNEEFQKAIGIKADADWDDLDEEMKNKIAEYTDDDQYKIPLSKIINPEDAKKVMDEYGYQYDDATLQNVVNLLEQRNQKEREYQAILAKETQSKEYDSQIQKLQTMQDAYDKIKEYAPNANWDSFMSQGTTAEIAWSNLGFSENEFDKEQFIRDYNLLKSLYGTLDVELGIDGATLQDIQKKLDEVNDLKVQLDAEVSPNEKERIQAEIDKLEGEIDGLTTDVKLDFEVTGLGSAGKVFDDYTSKMETLASIQSAVANGFTISAEKAREFAATYPEILAMATTTANGQIALNSGVVNAFLSGKREELNAEIDAEIAKIDSQIASLDAKQQLAQAQLDLARDVANGNIQIDAQEMVAKINNSNALMQMLMENGMDETNAAKIAYAAMSGNAQEYNEIVKGVCDDMGWNFDESAKASADTIFTNMQNAKLSVVDFMKQCQEAAKAFAGMSSGTVQGSVVGNSGKGGTKTGGGNTKISVAEFKGTDTDTSQITYKTMDVNTLISNLQTTIDGYNTTRKQLQGTKALLEAQKNRTIKSFDPDKDSGGSDGDTPAEAIQKYYERKIKDLEGQQTWIENEIEKLETQEKGVSADYYEKQIDLEGQKIALYEQERAELLKLERTDEVADKLWEVEHAIQESTLRMIEFRKSIAELYATASENITEAYGRRQQLSDDKTSFIENEISIRETKGELTPTSVYDDLIAEARRGRANAEEELKAQADLYWQGINNGDFEEGSDEALDILEKIRQKKLDMQEASKQEAEYIEQQKDAYIEYYDKMMEAYSHRNDFFQLQSDYAQSYIDRLGVLDINVPDEAYEKIAEIQELSIVGMREQLAFANSELENFKAQGIDKNDPRYIEKFKETLELEEEIYNKETEVYETHQQIFDNQIDRFNQVIDHINNATQRMQNVSGLLEREDVATEDGEWTNEGLTRLGMAYQQMEYYKQSADEIAKKMAEVTEAYENGEISEKKYYETMQELENQQWDAINSYEDMKDAIIDMEEARIDMIEEGLDKEIEAYQELIDLKKEELDAERDLYDFKKNIEKQTKDIAALERRIASMSGSSDASTIAERTKLEAELRNARDELDGSYRDHAYDSMSDALDNELDTYTTNAENYIESLRESIKNTDLLIEQTYDKVLQNTNIVLETITTLSNTYKFPIDSNLTAPWKNATNASIDFDTYATQHFNAVYEEVETKTPTLTGYTKAPWEAGESQARTFSLESQRYMTQEVVEYAEKYYKKQLTDTLNYPWDQANGYTSWGQGIQDMLKQLIKDSEEAGKKIAENVNVKPPSHEGTGDGKDGSGTNKTSNPGGKPTTTTTPSSSKVKALQEVLNTMFNAGLTVDGKYGPATTAAISNAQRTINSWFSDTKSVVLSVDGNYGPATRSGLIKYIDARITALKNSKNGSSMVGQGVQLFTQAKNKVPAAFAKGTVGTTHDQFAITDESWIGEEITLAAGKNGQLQYLKKGSAVMPADISANLVEWGKLNPDMMGIGSMTDGINLMSNYINKPEIKVDVENFLKVGTVSRDTLPELEKLMDKKIDTFAKQLNASIRKFK